MSPTDAVAQGCEFPNGKRLGTPFPVDPEFLQDGGDRLGPEGQSGLPEVVQERLAALGEAAPDDIAEQGRVVDGAQGFPPHVQPDQAGLHLGTRDEAGGRDTRLEPGLRVEGHVDGQGAVALRPRDGRQPLGHLALQHQHGPVNGLAGIEELQHDRARQVVGDVADHPDAPEPAFGPRGREVERQDISPDDLDIGHAPELRLQHLDETPVDLDGDHAPGASGEQRRQDADARADLDDGVRVANPGDPDDLLQDVRIAQEILAETLQRPDPVLTEKVQRAQHCGS